MTISASWIDRRLRIDAYKPDPECPVVERGFALYLTSSQADWLRRVIEAGPENKSPCNFPEAG